MPSKILYYDGQCPLCSAEMQKLKKHSNGQLQLQDIHLLQEESDLPNKQDLLTVLHLKNSDGEFLTGLDANIAAWQYTRFGFLLTWLRWPLIGSVADLVYNFWAKRRYQRLYDNPDNNSQEGDN
ncbi:DUF393 domain-containing protein [uncultured Oceanicoccus sp.]|uniref:thiol-disulfide oxidoreductase DCC family protein n=1 Tax=uncultured Oceanicoccus sp. TaxID=1706381 RepID=UPI0030D76379